MASDRARPNTLARVITPSDVKWLNKSSNNRGTVTTASIIGSKMNWLRKRLRRYTEAIVHVSSDKKPIQGAR